MSAPIVQASDTEQARRKNSTSHYSSPCAAPRTSKAAVHSSPLSRKRTNIQRRQGPPHGHWLPSRGYTPPRRFVFKVPQQSDIPPRQAYRSTRRRVHMRAESVDQEGSAASSSEARKGNHYACDDPRQVGVLRRTQPKISHIFRCEALGASETKAANSSTRWRRASSE